MTIETILVKRGARHAGEVGFFPTTPMAEEDIAVAQNGEELICSFYSQRNLEALKFLWALIDKTAQNSDRYMDKSEAMDDLKIRAGYTRVIYDDATKKLEVRPKSLKRISAENLRQLTEKMITIICDDVLPGMKPNQLREEIEKMCGVEPQSQQGRG